MRTATAARAWPEMGARGLGPRARRARRYGGCGTQPRRRRTRGAATRGPRGGGGGGDDLPAAAGARAAAPPARPRRRLPPASGTRPPLPPSTACRARTAAAWRPWRHGVGWLGGGGGGVRRPVFPPLACWWPLPGVTGLWVGRGGGVGEGVPPGRGRCVGGLAARPARPGWGRTRVSAPAVYL